jgi:hypothetical protein
MVKETETMMKKYALSLLLVCVWAAPLAAQSNFTFTAKKDPMTDVDRSFILVPGTDNKDTTLVWQCAPATDRVVPLDVFFVFGGYIAAPARVREEPVDVRFPPHPLMHEHWVVVEFEKQQAMKPHNFIAQNPLLRNAPVNKFDGVTPFIKQALQASTVALQIRARATDTIYTETFSLTGLAEALKQLPCVANLGLILPTQ